MNVAIIAFSLLAIFYLIYIAKFLILLRQNIQVDILGKGEKPKGRAALEIVLKCITYLGAAIQFVSVIFDKYLWKAYPAAGEVGLVLMLFGVAAFASAAITMKNNWRAGYSDGQSTALVTTGIYKYSRNPAFLGFDLLYVGCALAYPNPVNIAVTAAAVVLFHFQILGEEKFLTEAFGQEYLKYRATAMRYLGARKY